jgi:hypothetical protein
VSRADADEETTERIFRATASAAGAATAAQRRMQFEQAVEIGA